MYEVKIKHPVFETSVREQLGIFQRPLNKNDVQQIRELDLSCLLLDAEDMETLGLFTKLHSLTLYCHTIPRALNNMSELEEVYLEFLGDTLDLRMFPHLNNLRKLYLSGGALSGMNILHLEALSPMEKLQHLTLHEFGGVDLQALKKMPQLTSFFCGYAGTVENIEAISSMINLTELTLIDICTPTLAFLDALPDTMYVDLCGVQVQHQDELRRLERFIRCDACEMMADGKMLPSIRIRREARDKEE